MKGSLATVAVAALMLLGIAAGAAPARTPAMAVPAAPSDPVCAVSSDHAPNPGGLPLRLGGSIIRPDVDMAPVWGPWWGDSDWAGLMTGMQPLCMDTLVVQWTAQTWSAGAAPACLSADGLGRFVQPVSYAPWYPAWQANFSQSAGLTSGCAPQSRTDQVGWALQEAAAHGIKVWLGLQIDEKDWFNGGPDNAVWMTGQAQLSQDIMQQLWAAYGGAYSDTIAGFYVPFEADASFTTNPAREANYKNYLAAVSDWALHDLKTSSGAVVSKPLMLSPISPAHIGTVPASGELAAWTATVADWVTGTDVTVVAPQDAVGAGTATAADLGPWAKAASDGAAKAGSNPDGTPKAQYWSNDEAYETPNFTQQAYEPNMPVNTVLADMNAVASGGAAVGKYISFSTASFDPTAPVNGSQHHHWQLNADFHSAWYHYLTALYTPAQSIPAVTDVHAVFPPAPRDTAKGGSLTLTWTPVVSGVTSPAPVRPVAGYRILRDGMPIGETAQCFTDAIDPNSGLPTPTTADTSTSNYDTCTPSFTDTNLQSGRIYTYQVLAFDPFGNTSPASAAQVVNMPTDPAHAATAYTAPSTASKGTDLALHASYTVGDTTGDPSTLSDGSTTPQAFANYPSVTYLDAPSVNKLLDGTLGTPNPSDPAWSGQTNTGAYQIRIDLGAARNINTIRSQWLSSGSTAPPAQIDVASAPDTTTSPAPTQWQPLPGVTNTTSADPSPAAGVVWKAQSLPAGHTVNTRWLQLTITPPDTNPAHSTLVAAVQAFAADGITDYALNRTTASAATITSTTQPGTSPNMAAHPLLGGGKLTDGHTLTTDWSGYVGWNTNPGTGIAHPSPGSTMRITLDLGANQPIGQLSSQWLYDWAGGGIARPDTISYSYRADADPARGQVTDTWHTLPPASPPGNPVSSTITPYTTTLPTHATARWIRLDITVPNIAGAWLFAGAIHAYAPDTTSPTINVNGASTTQPTVYSSTDGTLGTLTPCTTQGPPCQTRSTTGTGTLTGVTASGTPTTGSLDWWNPQSNWVGLQQHQYFNIIVPTTGSPTSLNEIQARFLTDQKSGIYLPQCVTYSYSTDPNAATTPATATWQPTQTDPNAACIPTPDLPNHLPPATGPVTYTYSSQTPLNTTTPITAIRITIQPVPGQWAYTDNTAAYTWAN